MEIKYLLSLLTPLYQEHQVVVKTQRKGCQKGGHYKIKTQGDLIVSKEIAIDTQDNQAGMIYTLIHETTHMYFNHPLDKSLTTAQKEVVADQVAKHFIVKWDLIEQLKLSNVYNRLGLDTYSQTWLNNRQFSDKRSDMINQQIDQMIDVINSFVKE